MIKDIHNGVALVIRRFLGFANLVGKLWVTARNSSMTTVRNSGAMASKTLLMATPSSNPPTDTTEAIITAADKPPYAKPPHQTTPA
jgi:hypothetical protein